MYEWDRAIRELTTAELFKKAASSVLDKRLAIAGVLGSTRLTLDGMAEVEDDGRTGPWYTW